MSHMDFGKKLAKLIDGEGRRAADVARVSGVAQSTISGYKKRRKTPALLKNALRLAEALQVTLEYLADDRQEKPPEPMSEEWRRAWEMVRYLGPDVALRRLVKAEDKAEDKAVVRPEHSVPGASPGPRPKRTG